MRGVGWLVNLLTSQLSGSSRSSNWLCPLALIGSQPCAKGTGRYIYIYITWTDISVIHFRDDDKRDVSETLVYLLFKHLMRLLAQGSLIEFTYHEISRMYIMVHILHSVISNKSSRSVTVAVCTPFISSTPLWHKWHLGWNHNLHKSKYAQTWWWHDELWCNIIGCASFCYYNRTSRFRPSSSPVLEIGWMRAVENVCCRWFKSLSHHLLTQAVWRSESLPPISKFKRPP